MSTADDERDVAEVDTFTKLVERLARDVTSKPSIAIVGLVTALVRLAFSAGTEPPSLIRERLIRHVGEAFDRVVRDSRAEN